MTKSVNKNRKQPDWLLLARALTQKNLYFAADCKHRFNLTGLFIFKQATYALLILNVEQLCSCFSPSHHLFILIYFFHLTSFVSIDVLPPFSLSEPFPSVYWSQNFTKLNDVCIIFFFFRRWCESIERNPLESPRSGLLCWRIFRFYPFIGSNNS